MADDRFTWHPQARLFGPGGQETSAMAPAATVISPDPGPTALALALASSAPFRIGLIDAPAPQAGPRPLFETLTAGSTQTPRRIIRSHASWTASFAVTARLFGLGPGRRLAVLGSLVHSLSLYGAIEGLHLGAEVHLLGGLRPDRQAAALAERRIDTLYATPAQLRGLRRALPDLRLILIGGAKLDSRLRADLASLAPQAVIREFYGAAEASFITLADAGTPDGSVGRAYPGVQIDIREGEVWLRSPYGFQGYATEVGSARWQDGWLTVGEIGRLEDGYLYLSGRKGRMVTVADQNVFPEEIEGLMQTLPGITEVAILPMPDVARGHVLQAVAMGDPAQEPAILSHLRATLGPLKSPRRIVWRGDWPRLPSGKTDLRAIKAGL
ncbi:MAG: AMP-binding protein [Paracoccaceae bacterium]